MPSATARRTMAERIMDEAALYRLMTWLSPAYPTGGFSYSHGLEYAVEAGLVVDAESLAGWLDDILRFGAGRNDAILFAAAHDAAAAGDGAALAEVAELAAAWWPASELALESTAQGQAFLAATMAAWPAPGLDLLAAVWQGPLALPVAVAVSCAAHRLPRGLALAAFVQGFAASLVSAGIRLIPLGQTAGQQVIARIEATVAEVAAEAAKASLDALGSATMIGDWCAMKHESQHTRLFRS